MRLCDLIDSGFDIGMATATDYPIFDEAYRPVLNQRITDHYALYEIGHETPGMFKFALNRRLREIMKYYNQLYLSEKIAFDPLSTMDYTDDTTSTNAVNSSQNATNHNTNDTSSRARVVNSELPQVHLSPDEDYASSGADTASDTTAIGDGTSTTTGTDTANGTVNHTTQGRQGSASALLMSYRASLLNIDLMVIKDCADLFMGVWNTNDEYSTHGRMYGSVFVADGYPEI
jgi:hypothetical protein